MNDAMRSNPELLVAEEEISLMEMASAALRHWRVLVVIPLLLAAGTVLRGFAEDRSYAATASFIPQGAEGQAPGGAAALAQQFGVSLGGSRSGQSPQFYADLLRSTTLLRKAVEAQYELPTEEGPVRGTLIQYWDIEGEARAPHWREAIGILRSAISTGINPETGVIRLTVTSDHPVMAEMITAKLLELLNEFNLEVRRNRAEEEGRFIRERLKEAEAQVRMAEHSLQSFLRQNREFRNSPELTFEHDRQQRQVAIRQDVYLSLLRSQEQTRLDAVRDTPLFTVIDHPEGTAQPTARGTITRAALAFLLGLLLAALVIVLLEFARRSGKADDPRYREFQRAARDAWRDFRHPSRWKRRPDKTTAAAPSETL